MSSNCPPLTGTGGTAIFGAELFEKRMELVKRYTAISGEHRLEVLYALQCAVAKLAHPPSK